MPGLIDPKRIRTDLGTQTRVAMNDDVVREYADAMELGAEFPPILVYYDEPQDIFILADGHHRLAAHLLARPNEQISAEQVLGDVSDALWAGIGANISHGLRRTNEDKRNATTLALTHQNGAKLSDRQIALHTGVSHPLVGCIRAELESAGILEPVPVREGIHGRKYTTSFRPCGSGFKVDRAPIPETANCGNCLHWTGTRCKKDGEDKPQWQRACERWKLNDNPPESAAEKTRRTPGMYPYERHGECLTVELSPTNPGLFAVELRNRFHPNFLAACIAELKRILADNEA